MIHFKLTIVALLWAGGFIAGKLITHQAGPFTISFIRFFIAAVFLVLLARKKEENAKMDVSLLIYVFLAAMLGIFCYNYLFFEGIKFIDAGRGSIIISTAPIVVVILSCIFLKERMNGLRFLGAFLSIFGAWVVITKGQMGAIINEALGKGEIYLLGCVFCIAIFTLLSKHILKKLKPMQTMSYVTSIGAVLLFIPALMEMEQGPTNMYSLKFLVNILYLAIGPSVVASVLYCEAIGKVGASRASQYLNLVPVFAVLLSSIFLGEAITTSVVFGGGLVTSGLYLTNINS
jgi:drug/metabolite transporter (DMT)-like permease